MKAGGRTFRRKPGPLYRDRGSREGEGFPRPLTRHPREAGVTEESRLARGEPRSVQSLERPCLPQDKLLACEGRCASSPEASGRAGGGSQLLT